jgi:hypothetical protein
MTTKQKLFQSPRKAAVGFACVVAGLTSAFGALAVPAAATVSPPVFENPHYDTYLKAAQRGVTAESMDEGGTACPEVAAVAGETGWHFVLDGSSHDFATIDVAFSIDGVQVVLVELTPKAADDPTFDIALNYVASPTGKHAYVYTPSSGTLLDAAAFVSPQALLGDFQLSHTCVGEGATTSTESTTTTTEGTKTTESAPTTTQGTTTTAATVLGATTPAAVLGVQVTRELPRTGGSSTLPLLWTAIVLLGAGMALLSSARLRTVRSS